MSRTSIDINPISLLEHINRKNDTKGLSIGSSSNRITNNIFNTNVTYISLHARATGYLSLLCTDAYRGIAWVQFGYSYIEREY